MRTGSHGPVWRLPTPRRKYYNEITEVDGHQFASRREANRYAQLRLLERAGAIADLELQPEFILYAPVLDETCRILDVRRIGSYFGDFRYRDRRSGAVIVEDAKGVRTPLYRFKRKLVETQREPPEATPQSEDDARMIRELHEADDPREFARSRPVEN